MIQTLKTHHQLKRKLTGLSKNVVLLYLNLDNDKKCDIIVQGITIKSSQYWGNSMPGLSSLQVDIKKQPHNLAWINKEEQSLLKDLGGSGRPGPMGIPAYEFSYDDDQDLGDVTGSPGGAAGAGVGGGSGGDGTEGDSPAFGYEGPQISQQELNEFFGEYFNSPEESNADLSPESFAADLAAATSRDSKNYIDSKIGTEDSPLGVNPDDLKGPSETAQMAVEKDDWLSNFIDYIMVPPVDPYPIALTPAEIKEREDERRTAAELNVELRSRGINATAVPEYDPITGRGISFKGPGSFQAGLREAVNAELAPGMSLWSMIFPGMGSLKMAGKAAWNSKEREEQEKADKQGDINFKNDLAEWANTFDKNKDMTNSDILASLDTMINPRDLTDREFGIGKVPSADLTITPPSEMILGSQREDETKKKKPLLPKDGKSAMELYFERLKPTPPIVTPLPPIINTAPSTAGPRTTDVLSSQPDTDPEIAKYAIENNLTYQEATKYFTPLSTITNVNTFPSAYGGGGLRGLMEYS